MSDTEKIELIKQEVREKQIPYFEDEDFVYYLKKNNGDVNKTIYEMLLIKSEDSTVYVSGLKTQDTSKYFKMLASKYRPNNSGILK